MGDSTQVLSDGGLETSLRGWARFFTILLVVYCVLGWRIYLPRGDGQAVPAASTLIAIIFLGGIILDRSLRSYVLASVRRLPWLSGFIGLWTAFSLAAPLAGFPVHTMVGATTPLAIAAFSFGGSLMWREHLVSHTDRHRALMIIAWTQFTVGAMQALWNTGVSRLLPLSWLSSWDVAVMRAYGVELFTGRSVGLYLNPNPYTLLGALVLVVALRLDLSQRERLWLAFPSAGIVFLGASRGVIIALALVALPYVIGRVRMIGWRRSTIALCVIIAGALAIHLLLSVTSSPVYARFLNRWASVPALLAHGPSADINAIGRLDAWAKALTYWLKRPFGTIGPPQMAAGTFMDNDLVALLVQGGLLLAAGYLGALYACFRRRLESPIAPVFAPIIALVLLAGLSQNAIAFLPTVAILWSVLGSVGPSATDAAASKG